MAQSSESNASKKFIDSLRKKYGENLYIEKQMSTTIVGQPDIYIIFKSMPLHGESKYINEISLTNNREFTKIQLYNLGVKSKAGAMCIGILLHKNITKFMMLNELKPHITKEDFLNAKEFDLEYLWNIWKRRLQ